MMLSHEARVMLRLPSTKRWTSSIASFSASSTLRTSVIVIGNFRCWKAQLTFHFSEQLKNNYNLGKYYVEVDFGDLKTFNEDAATKLSHFPNKFMPEVGIYILVVLTFSF